MAGMPVYDLLGGKVREEARVYRHADGRTLEEVGDRVQAFLEDGVQVVRIQHGGYGGNAYQQALESMRPEARARARTTIRWAISSR